MKVLIVEDDAVHRAFLRDVLAGTFPGCDCIEAENGLVGERLAREHAPGNVVVDLQMPHRTGVEMAKTLWRERPGTSILFWSNYADEAYVRGVSRIVPTGAAYGYVLKSASEERLGLALRSVFLEGQCVIDREIRSVQQTSADRSDSFTDVEYEILLDLALGLTDRLIAERRSVSLRSVQNRLQQIYDKLGVYESEGGTEAFNLRMRAVTLAFLRKLLNRGSLEQAEAELAAWLERKR
ncbi:two-component system response regulator [Aureimonas sp. Leaf454]|uniref:response regulator transcription factor n=1 Tax=Aureimonas sp. Leaf454 TaxID=1736381 RepID=UPI0006FDD59A|nr:response regulator transcription factor [Aureimonas sp. Leaf454]KQT46303.1 two-component system response regulator [Aureimonas sp. Leaf454]